MVDVNNPIIYSRFTKLVPKGILADDWFGTVKLTSILVDVMNLIIYSRFTKLVLKGIMACDQFGTVWVHIVPFPIVPE